MKLTTRVGRVRTLRSGDKDFLVVDSGVATPRAGFEISTGCPEGYRHIILECIRNSWLRPVAHVLDEELMWDKLRG